MTRASAVVLLVVAVFGRRLSAQVVFDPARGVYHVPLVTGGVSYDLKVEPANRVVASTVVSTSVDSSGRVRYRYSFLIDPSSPQWLSEVFIPCPSSTAPEQFVAGRIQLGLRTFRAKLKNSGRGPECAGILGIAPGDSGAIRFFSHQEPGMGTIILRGRVAGVGFPTSDPNEDTEALHSLIDSLEGRSANGLVRRVSSLVPKYPLSTIAQASTGLPILRDELAGICAATDWIQPGSTCADLAAQLDAASGALGASPAVRASPPLAARNAVRQALTLFLQSVSAGRGTTINENAFSILNVLGRTVRSGVAP